MQVKVFGGAQYLRKGFSLVRQKGIRFYVLVPLIINIVLLTFATSLAFDYLSQWYAGLQASDYQIVRWFVEYLGWLIWPLIVLGVFVSVFFVFAFIANWIAAPFNGLLAEAVERHLAGQQYQGENYSLLDNLKDIPRLFSREFQKLAYYIPRAILCLLLFFIIGPLAPIVWFVFNAWMCAIQYIDYPQDNHRREFSETLALLKQRRSGPFAFGTLVMLFTMIPVLNIFIMPVAVAGATAMWFDHYRRAD